MALALDGVASRLRVYGAARRRPEMQTLLLAEVDELKTACVSPEELLAAAGRCGGNLATSCGIWRSSRRPTTPWCPTAAPTPPTG
jgi:hypothetical protein